MLRIYRSGNGSRDVPFGVWLEGEANMERGEFTEAKAQGQVCVPRFIILRRELRGASLMETLQPRGADPRAGPVPLFTGRCLGAEFRRPK